MKLVECLDFMAEQGFFTADELHEALVAVADDLDVPADLQRVVDVVMAFRIAAE